jgi:hypothetical protein
MSLIQQVAGKLIGSHRCLGGERRRTDDEGKFHGLLLCSLIGLRVILAKEKAPGKLGLSSVILDNSG